MVTRFAAFFLAAVAMAGRAPAADPVLIGGLPVVNGTIYVEGTVRFSTPIVFPTSPNGNPQDFAIIGRGVGARLEYMGTEQPAIVSRVDGYPGQYAGGSLQRRIENVHLMKASVLISGGGKYHHIRDVDITNVPATAEQALLIDTFDGGEFSGVNVHDNDCPGAKIINSHTVVPWLTTRSNAGTGLYVRDCLFGGGRLYSESNTGRNFDFENLSRSPLGIWNENGWHKSPAAPTAMLSRMRNCWGNVFSGMDQHVARQGWDCDPLSLMANRFDSDPANFGLAQLPPANGADLKAAAVNFAPSQVIEGPAGGFSMPANALGWEQKPGNARYMIFSDATRALDTVPVDIGDYFVVAGKISTPNADYLSKNPRWPLFRFFAYAAGQQTSLGQNVWASQAEISFVSEPVAVLKKGAGIRLYTYLDTGVGASRPLPEQPITWSFSNFRVMLIKGSGNVAR